MDFLDQIAKETGQNAQEIKRMYESQRINPVLVAYISKLHDRVKTGLLTNASEEQLRPVLEQSKLDKIFDSIVMSSVVGLAKPDPRIFELALKRLEVEPAEAVFIDDLRRYTNSARELGINTIVYKNFDQMKSELEPLLAAGPDN